MAVIFEIIRSIFRSVFGRLGSLTTDVAEELADHGLEMRVFAMLPAVAWENYNTYGAWIRSSEVLTKTKGLYSDSYWQTLLFGFILGAPLYVIDIYLHANNIETPNPILIFIYLGYAGIAWSLRMYTNQLVVTQLYLCSDALDAARSASPYETITLADIDLPEILSN